LSNLAFLKVPNGAQWEVELAECDGGVWLSKGWLDFAKYYSVQPGHFIVFRYEGNSVFHVLILEETALEIEHYRSDGEEAKLDGEFEAPNMEETKGETSLPKKCTQPKETKLEKSKSKANANTTNREFKGVWKLMNFGLLICLFLDALFILSHNLVYYCQLDLIFSKGR
jgi:hypothetical protein